MEMNFPFVTSVYAALLTLVFLAISFWVSAGRGKYGVFVGDGGQPGLLARMRAHANFTEYVPLALLLVALLEGRRTSIYIIHALLFVLLIARILHPFGMVAPPKSRRLIFCRGLPATATWLVMIVAAVLLLVKAVTAPPY
jgi:uncharacterized membrane protein YecN with MAPEG domain